MNKMGVSPNRRNSHFFSKVSEMKISKIWIGFIASLCLVLVGCGEPEIAGDAVVPETGMLRVVNLSDKELEVKFGSQLNASPLAKESGTRWQKQRAGSVTVSALTAEKDDLGGKVEVAKDKLTTFVIMPSGTKTSQKSHTEEPAKGEGTSVKVRVVLVTEYGDSVLKVTPQGGSTVETKGDTPAELSIEKAGAARLKFEVGSKLSLEREVEFEEGGSYTIFVSDGVGDALAVSVVQNNQKLNPVGESGATP